MIRIIFFVIVGLLMTNLCEAALQANASIDEILDALDARGQGLKSFTADVKLSETDAATGDATARSGHVIYQAADSGARIRVTFDDKESNGKVLVDKIEYLLSGPDLIDRTYRTKTQVTRHVLKPGEKLNLLKLGEGPFPLPIGQKKEDVHAMFDVSKVEFSKDDPGGTIHLKLSPKSNTRFERRFKSIDVWVDQADAMPRRIQTIDPNETTARTTDLSNVKVNPNVSDTDFSLPHVGDDWQLIEEAYQE